jgi:hypothetical protein
MPVLQQNCTASPVCHGQMGDGAVEGLFLGVSSDGATIEPSTAMMVYAGLVGAKSLEDPSMDLVSPNEPQSSYLVYKLNGNQDTLAADCAKTTLCPSTTCTSQTPCGTSMPYLGAPLMPSGLQPITEWIMQGAPNN